MISQWDSLSRDNARQKLDDEMTERVAASAPHGFQGNASFRYNKRSDETNVKSRLLEVATWVWYIAAVGFAVWAMIGAAFLYVIRGRLEEVLGMFALYAGCVVIATLAVWTTRYVVTGQRQPFGKTLKATAFGNLALYFWFVPAVIYFGALGNAVWQDAAYDDLRMQHLAEGAGGAMFVLILGAPGWFFAPRALSHVGHMIGTIIAGVLTLAWLILFTGAS